MPYSTPTQIYLRGYYGYKNFGDELLFFGIIDRIANEYKTKNIYVEVGDITWMTKRVQKNKNLFTAKNIHLVEIKQHKRKWLTHIINMLGFGKYKAYFKCFGGGEVLSDERPIPHDGRNIPLLFNASVRKRNFALFGGIGKANKRYTHILYKYLLPKARAIVARDKESYKIAYKYNPKTYLHEDFALEVLRNWNPKIPQQQIIPGEYILVNLNSGVNSPENIQKIQTFCQNHPKAKKIFFASDKHDDMLCFENIKKIIPEIEIYDRTQHSLLETFNVLKYTKAGIGSRLHFLLALQYFSKPIEVIIYADKIRKVILKK